MNYEPVTEGVDPPSLGGGAAGELLEVVPLWRRVSPQEGAVGEGLGDLLGDPVVGQDHALGHRLVDLEVLLRLDVLHVRRLELEADLGALQLQRPAPLPPPLDALPDLAQHQQRLPQHAVPLGQALLRQALYRMVREIYTS